MPYSFVELEVRDGIAFLTLSRPRAANAVNDAMAIEFAEACRSVRQSKDIRVVILSGKGKGFCSGGDLVEFAESVEKSTEGMAQRLMLRSGVVDAVAALDRPTIAAVHGYALGIGLALAMACDIKIAAEGAFFASPDTGKGYIPVSGITQRLPRIVGRGKAMEMMLTGERIDAQEAWRIGLVNKVVPPDRLLQEAEAMARQLASKAPIAARFIREAAVKGLNTTIDQGLRLEADLYYLLFSTRDRVEGVTAFREKRPPRFVGE